MPFPPDIIACLEFWMEVALEVEQEEEELEEAGRLEQACPQRSPEPWPPGWCRVQLTVEYLPDTEAEARAENPEVLLRRPEGRTVVSGRLLKFPIFVAKFKLLVFLLLFAVFHWLSSGRRSSPFSIFMPNCLFWRLGGCRG